MRDYAGDKNEQMKVMDYSKPQNFDARHLLSDDPSPANGPPMVDERNSAIGGNNRAMIARRVYGDQVQGAKLKAATVEAAGKFGLDPQQLAGMKKPVIVRRLAESGMSPGRLTEMSRILQKGRTQETSDTVDAISRAKVLMQKPGALDAIDHALGSGKSIREVLGKEGESRRLLHHLENAGVLTPQEVSKYATPQGTFSEEGKRLVERTLLGTVAFDNPHLLDDAPGEPGQQTDGECRAVGCAQARGPDGTCPNRSSRRSRRITASAPMAAERMRRRWKSGWAAAAAAMSIKPASFATRSRINRRPSAAIA